MVLGAALTVLSVPIEALARTMEKLTDTFRESIAFADATQKASLALGRDLTQTTAILGPSLLGLRGSIEKQLTQGMAGLEEGLHGNMRGMMELVNQQILTGGNWKKTLPVFAKMNAIMGLNNDELNLMGVELIRASEKYGISTDVLVDTIAKLDEHFVTMNLADIPDDLAKATATLVAKYGKQVQQPMDKILNLLLAPGWEAFTQRALLGLQNSATELKNIRSTTDAVEILEGMIMKGGSTFEMMFNTTEDFNVGLTVANDVLGKTGGAMAVLRKRILEGEMPQAKFNAAWGKFADQISVMVEEVLNPLRVVFMEFYDPLKLFLESMTFLGSTLLTRFSDWVRELIPAKSAVADFSLAIVNMTIVAVEKLETVWNFIHELFTVHMPAAWEFMKQGLWEVFREGGLWTSFMSGIWSFMGIVAEVAQWVTLDKADHAWKQREKRWDFRADNLQDLVEANQGAKYDPMWATKSVHEAATRAAEKERSEWYNSMIKFRDDLATGNDIQREQSDYLRSIDDKTPDPFGAAGAKSSEFLEETAFVLGRSIEAILGISPGTSLGDVVEAVEGLHEPIEAAGSTTGGGGGKAASDG